MNQRESHVEQYKDEWARSVLPGIDEWPLISVAPPCDYPEIVNCANRFLGAALDDRRSKSAILEKNSDNVWVSVTYAELLERVDSIAHVLINDLALVPGNRVLLRGYNGSWLAAAWLAVVKAGCIAVTTMPLLRSSEIETIIRRSNCNAALCDIRLSEELVSGCEKVDLQWRPVFWGQGGIEGLESRCKKYLNPFSAHESKADDTCIIAFTSGTTGVPKGCMHFHRDVMAMCDTFSRSILNTSDKDICIGTPPLAFTFGLGGLLCFPLAAGATTVLMERCTPETLLCAIKETSATLCFTAPTFYRQMALEMRRNKSKFDVSSLRESISAGEALPDATRKIWREETSLNMLDGIGATEMIHIFIASAGPEIRDGAIGRAVPGYEVKVLDDNGVELKFGEVGRLAVRGPTGCRYLSDERQRDYVKNGWNLTGDAVSMDADGYVYFKSRTDDLIISAGHNIGAPEVEAAVLLYPDVVECAVAGVPDEERGQIVKAFVVMAEGVEKNGNTVVLIQEHVKLTIAPYKYPRIVEFVDSLPKTDTGKLQRFRLRATP